jgi:hypothetical protein
MCLPWTSSRDTAIAPKIRQSNSGLSPSSAQTARIVKLNTSADLQTDTLFCIHCVSEHRPGQANIHCFCCLILSIFFQKYHEKCRGPKQLTDFVDGRRQKPGKSKSQGKLPNFTMDKFSLLWFQNHLFGYKPSFLDKN